jgi:ATP-dependent metalloprotease
VAMGGRAAEELIFSKDKVTGGASHDLEGATAIAEIMVKKLGMSEKIGLRVIPDSQGFAGRSQELGPATTELIDSEVSRLLNESYKRAIGLLKSHRRELDLLAEALLNYETLDADDIRSIIDGDPKTVDAKMASSNRVLVLSRTRGGQQAAGTPPQPKVTGKPDILGVQ